MNEDKNPKPQDETVGEAKKATEPASDLKPIRTYESDVAEVMANKRTSRASIAIAESREKEGEDRLGDVAQEEVSRKRTSKKLLIILISLVLILGGAGGAYYLYLMSPLAPLPQAPELQPSSPAIIIADGSTLISADNLNLLAILARIRMEIDRPLEPSTLQELILTRTETVPKEAPRKVRLTSQEMLSLMDIDAPDILTRSLAPAWFLGTYTDDAGMTDTFIIVTTTFFQNTFAGMLQWEQVMADDLKLYVHKDPPAIVRGQFQDQIVSNKDVRVFITDAGEPLFVYSFITNDKLVIAGKTSTVAELLERLEQQTFIR